MTDMPPSPDRAGRIVAVTNQKGGVGKTTTVVNLGAAIAAGGLRCLIVDMDPQGNASTGLGSFSTERKATAYDVVTGTVPLADAIVTTPAEGLDLVPGSTDLSGLDIELTAAEDRATRLKAVLGRDSAASVCRRYDYVLIDCPPALNLLTVNALAAADRIVVPLQAEFFALEGVTQLAVHDPADPDDPQSIAQDSRYCAHNGRPPQQVVPTGRGRRA